jgi:hypothetical protein
MKAVGWHGARRHIKIGLSRRVEIETGLIGVVGLSIELRDETVAIRNVVSTQSHIRDCARKPSEDRLKAPDELLEQMNPGSERHIDVGLDRVLVVEIDHPDGRMDLAQPVDTLDPLLDPHRVELVTGPLFEGRTDPDRLQLVVVDEASGARAIFPPPEDMIANRLAQYASDPKGHDDMLEQAHLLASLAENLDMAYLKRRVAEEGADPGLVDSLMDSGIA